MESIILSSLGIYKEKIPARECETREISLKEYKDFFKGKPYSRRNQF